MTSWIPADIAKVGNTIRLKEYRSDPEWSEWWTIETVGDPKPGNVVEAKAPDYKHQREMSDV